MNVTLQIENDILTLAKKYDGTLSRFDRFLKETLLFKLFESPNDVLPDHEKKYYNIAIKKGWLTEKDVEDLKKWRKDRNFLTHNPDEEIIPYYEEYKTQFEIIQSIIKKWKHIIEKKMEDD